MCLADGEGPGAFVCVNAYKCWANLCFIIDEVLRVKLKPHWCFPQLIKATKSHTVSWDEVGQGISDYTSILSSFVLSEQRVSKPCSAALLQHVLLPLQGFSSCVYHRHPRVTLFISLFFRFQRSTQESQHKSLQLLTLFKSNQKVSFLKQIRNLFPAQHTLSAFQAPHTLLASFLACSLTRLPTIPTIPKLSPVNQCYNLPWTHPRRHSRDNEDKCSGCSVKERRTE